MWSGHREIFHKRAVRYMILSKTVEHLLGHLEQCISPFVRPQPGKFIFPKKRARSEQIYSYVGTFPFFKFIH